MNIDYAAGDRIICISQFYPHPDWNVDFVPQVGDVYTCTDFPTIDDIEWVPIHLAEAPEFIAFNATYFRKVPELKQQISKKTVRELEFQR